MAGTGIVVPTVILAATVTVDVDNVLPTTSVVLDIISGLVVDGSTETSKECNVKRTLTESRIHDSFFRVRIVILIICIVCLEHVNEMLLLCAERSIYINI